ncbi:MAG: psp operon transcriptional activator [Desulforhopalus sp.]|jgi:psp operon transcriptional activator
MQLNKEAIGRSESFLDFQERLSRVAPVERPVLLMGERGTGKELGAKRLHFLSKRWDGPFITLNCATLSPHLIESELFGHEKGAFTGADSKSAGRFELADGGTLFLDEIGSIPLEAQEKILRVVEYGFFERVGGEKPVEVDVRIVGATNADLAAMSERNQFKKDLLDRLSFEVLFLPPLRYRGEDVMFLADYFGSRMSYELGRSGVVTFSRETTRQLENHSWPGNIRELKNVVERAVYQAETSTITAVVFDPFVSPYGALEHNEFEPELLKEERSLRYSPILSTTNSGTLDATVREVEISMIKNALDLHHHNRKKAAVHLGLSYDQLRGKMRKYGDELH